jgi:hypothetical protein
MKPKLILGLALVLSGGLFVVFSVWSPFQNFHGHNSYPQNRCIDNLRIIDAAKQEWALDNKKTTNDVPTWNDILPMMRTMPICPDGGTYTIGRVGEPPTCSIGTNAIPAHVLP